MKRIPLFLLFSSILAIALYEFKINFAMISAICIVIALFVPTSFRKLFLICIVFFLCVLIRIETIGAHNTSLLLEDDKMLYSGRIVSFPVCNDDRAQFILQLDSPYDEKTQAFVYNNTHTFSYGQKISFKGEVKIPDVKRNPGGFDYNKYLRSKEIYTTLSIDNESIDFTHGEYRPIEKIGLGFRNKFNEYTEEHFTEVEKNFILGLILGEKSIEESIRTNFNRLGVSHILSVSGLHIGYVYIFIYKVCQLFRLKKLPRFIIIGIFLYIYAFMVGFSTSVMRATWMCILLLAAELFNKKYDTINTLCLLASVYLLINPFTFYNVGFQLSYSAVLSIAVFYPYLNNRWRFNNTYIAFIKSLFLLTLSVQLGTTPITLYHFHTFSILSLIANLIIVPLAGFIILGFLYVFFISLLIPIISAIALMPIKASIHLILDASTYLSSLPIAYTNYPPLSLNATYIYYLSIFGIMGYFYLYKKKNRQILAIFLIPILLMTGFEFYKKDFLEITYLDVGQGDSALLEIPGGYTVLIDGGGNHNYNIGENIVLKALLAKGVREVDIAVVTHSHMDHQQGIIEIMDHIKITHLVVNGLEEEAYEEIRNTAIESGVNLHTNDEIDADMGKVQLDFLYPQTEDRYIDANNSSVILRVSYGDHSFLFTGDLEEEGENILLKRGEHIKSKFLKVGHHGSNTSSSDEFLQKVEAKYAIISVGKNNLYNHPSEAVIQRLDERGAEVYRTDYHGAIEILTNGSRYSIKTYID